MSNYQSMPQLDQIPLPERDQKALDSMGLSHMPNTGRYGAVELVNSERVGIPYKQGAIFRAYNDGSIPTAIVSGRALASEYDIVRWALSRKYTSRERDRKRYSA